MDVARSKRMQTIDALLDGYGSLSVAKLLEPLAPDFRHQTLPESLGMPVRDRVAFEKHAAGIFDIFGEFRMVPRTIVGDPVTGVVAIDAQMLGTLKGGKGEWKNECVMMVKLTEDGRQVLEVREFVDSAKAIEMARTHAPDDFQCKASIASNASNTEDESLLGWGSMDSDLWIHLGAVVVLLVGLHQILLQRT
ncbi:hypothetical protein O1611_g2456 [Lasiodiplodia mahajangana]|uniref:Uncharacterized protein n=1 Tax=Lasiodiplodia mahajangana TaxID=1108764 RepID=A0ACC2JVD3_9PEZI|nr:hypothetical protein O1611_g2456 [Lasiodiplodia mahajangana]